jgi:CheY-like chemotaxis protein
LNPQLAYRSRSYQLAYRCRRIGAARIALPHDDPVHRLIAGIAANCTPRYYCELVSIDRIEWRQHRSLDIAPRFVDDMTATSVGKKRILCVDDHEDTREMMRFLLEAFGYQPVIAASVSDALESARSGGLALCILDHWLSRSNGIELRQQIRGFDSKTPIVFYSSAAYEADIQKGLAAGAQAYLVKPDFDGLKQTIDRLIDETAPPALISRDVNPYPGTGSIRVPILPIVLSFSSINESRWTGLLGHRANGISQATSFTWCLLAFAKGVRPTAAVIRASITVMLSSPPRSLAISINRSHASVRFVDC